VVYKEQVSRENLYVDPSAATTRTVALTGTGFPDATNTLVALVNVSTSTAIATPDGWTPSGVGGANGNNQMRVFTKRGDGATNSVTIDSASAIATVGIFVAAGYAGLTPIIAGGGNGGTGTNFPFSGISGQPGNGLTILGIGLATAPSSWSAWSASTPILASQPSNARGWWGISDYIDGSGSSNSTVTWLGSRSQRYIAVVIPLQQVTASPETSAGFSGAGSLMTVVQPQTSAAGALGGAGQLAASSTGQGSASPAFSGSGQLTASSIVQTSATAALTGSGQLTSAAAAAARQTVSLSGSGDLTAVAPTQGTTVPTRAEMPAAPFDLYPAPTMAWVAGPAPSGSGFISADPSNAVIRLTGPAGKGVVAGSVSGFVNPAPLQDISGAGTGTNPLVFPPYGIRVRTDATEIWFRLAQRSYSGFSNVSGRAASRLKVNGKWTSLTPVYLGTNLGYPSNPDNITAGEYALKLTFPTAEMRDLELVTHLEFGGVVVPVGANGQTPPPPAHRVVMLDGSLTGSEKHQTGNFALTGGAQGTYTAVSSHLWYAAQVLAYDDVINVATGSSGYAINGDTVSFKSSSKIPRDVVDHNPATILVGGPNNDIGAGRTAAQVSADLDIILPAINAAFPNALRIIEGGFTAPAMGSQSSAEATMAPYNDAIRAKAQQYGWWFVNPTTGQTYNPQGVVVKTTSNWVYQDTSSIASDGVHPTQDGARKLGIMLADAIMPAHPSGAVEVPVTLWGAGSLSAAAVPSQTSTAALSGAGQLAASPVTGAGQPAGLTGAGQLTAVTGVTVARPVTLTGAGQLVVTADAAGGQASTFAGGGSLQVAGTPTVAGVASLSGSGGLVVVVSPAAARAVSFTGSGSLAAVPRAAAAAVAPISGSGALEVATDSSSAGAASFSGSGVLQVTRTASSAASAALAGTGALQASATPSPAAAVTFTGTGQLASAGRATLATGAALSGTGALTAATAGSGGSASALGGSGQLSAPAQIAAAAVLLFAGIGQLSGPGAPSSGQTASLSGDGSLSTLARAVFIAAVVTAGAGQLTAVTTGSTRRLERFMHLGRRDVPIQLTART
jgi:hypothetical protein